MSKSTDLFSPNSTHSNRRNISLALIKSESQKDYIDQESQKDQNPTPSNAPDFRNLKMMYNGKVFPADQLLKLRGHLVLECWKQVQEKKPFNNKEVGNIVVEITKSFEQL